MRVIQVENKALEQVFLRVPFYVQSDNPAWIPHLESDIRQVFDSKKNKLLKDGEAIRWVLADEKETS